MASLTGDSEKVTSLLQAQVADLDKADLVSTYDRSLEDSVISWIFSAHQACPEVPS